ncbi:helix-turn-helix domain-containing protein [Bacillus sp. FJAT-29953]|nr:helix-turn-helix domain-containing protein [Bacillus sp. FJAT-29953]
MIGEKIKQLREEKGYSLTELARLADVSKSYLSLLERGMQTNPSLQLIQKIALPLETSIEYLLGYQQELEYIEFKLDKEWKSLIQQAIENGLEKQDFKEYLNFLKFQEWMREQNK